MSAGSCTSPFSDERPERLVAQALDVHGAAAREVEQPLLPLAGQPRLVRAPVVRLALAANQRRAARRARSSASSTCARSSAASRAPARRPRGSRRRRGARSPCRPRGRPCAGPRPRCAASRCVIVTPPTNTGSSTANGVTLPVRPVCTSIFCSNVGSFLGRELVRDRPARRVRRGAELPLQLGRSTLIDHAVDLVVDRVPVAPPSARGTPRRRRSSRPPRWSAAPGARPSPPTSRNPRVRVERDRPRPRRTSAPTGGAAATAVTVGSFWRSDPAAALRGLANGRCPAAVSSSFSARTPSPASTPRRAPRAPRADPSTSSLRGHAADRADVGGDVLAGDAVAARGRLARTSPCS